MASAFNPIPALPAKSTGAMTALAALAAARNPIIRVGRSYRATNSANQEAHLAQVVGGVNSPPCEHCRRGCGVWVECVAVGGFLGGSCANCHYGNEGVRCSLRPRATAASVAAAVAAAAAADGHRALPSLLPPSAPRGRGRLQRLLVGPPGSFVAGPSGRAVPVPGGGPAASVPGARRSGRVGARVAAAPAPAPHPAAPRPVASRAGALTGQVRKPRRSRAERFRAMAQAFETLVECCLEEAERLEEEDDIE